MRGGEDLHGVSLVAGCCVSRRRDETESSNIETKSRGCLSPAYLRLRNRLVEFNGEVMSLQRVKMKLSRPILRLTLVAVSLSRRELNWSDMMEELVMAELGSEVLCLRMLDETK